MNYETFITALAVLGVLASAALYLRSRGVPANWQWLVQDLARDAVCAAEQAYDENKDKLDFAVDYVNAGLAKYGVKLPPVLVHGAVEYAVRELKDLAAAYEQMRTSYEVVPLANSSPVMGGNALVEPE